MTQKYYICSETELSEYMRNDDICLMLLAVLTLLAIVLLELYHWDLSRSSSPAKRRTTTYKAPYQSYSDMSLGDQTKQSISSEVRTASPAKDNE